jgi:hypothetical protein
MLNVPHRLSIRMGNRCVNIGKLDEGKASEKANASRGAPANTHMQHDRLERDDFRIQTVS